jgi:hypothetical protein
MNLPASLEQDREPRLLEMVITGQHFLEALGFHHLK